MSLVNLTIINGPDKETAERLGRIEEKLSDILANQETFKMSFDEDIASTKEAQAAVAAAMAAADAKLDAIKGDVEKLMATIANFPVGGLTPEQEAAVKEIRDSAAALAVSAGSLVAKAGAVDDLNP